MSPVGKALWFIERHFAGDLTLEDIANAAGVSRFHLTRAFGAGYQSFHHAVCKGPQGDGGRTVFIEGSAGHSGVSSGGGL